MQKIRHSVLFVKKVSMKLSTQAVLLMKFYFDINSATANLTFGDFTAILIYLFCFYLPEALFYTARTCFQL